MLGEFDAVNALSNDKQEKAVLVVQLKDFHPYISVTVRISAHRQKSATLAIREVSSHTILS